MTDNCNDQCPQHAEDVKCQLPEDHTGPHNWEGDVVVFAWEKVGTRYEIRGHIKYASFKR